MNLQPFSPAGETKTLAVSDTTGSVALTRAPGGAADLTVIVVNVGSTEAFVQFGASDVEATTSSTPIEPGQSMTFSVANTDAPYLAAITASSTTTLRATSGTGIPYGYGGGGSGGGGGGGAVTIADGADVAEGATTDAAATAGGTGTVSAKLRRISTQLPAVLGQTTMSASLPVVLANDQSAVPTSVADGSDVALGAIADAAATAGGTGTVSAKLRRISTQLPAALGLAPKAQSLPVAIAGINAGEYETVAASQTAQVLGPTGGTGDYLSGLLVIPATTSPGNVLLLDDATSITVFAGGGGSVASLIPFFIPLGMYSVSGAWKVTTGANVSVIGIGDFT